MRGSGKGLGRLSPLVGSVLRHEPHKCPLAFSLLSGGAGRPQGLELGTRTPRLPHAPAPAQVGEGRSPAAFQGPDRCHGECSGHLPARTRVPPPTGATG